MSIDTAKPEFTKRALRIPEFCERYNLGRGQVYNLISSGELSPLLVGGTRLIPVDEAEKLLKRRDPLRPSYGGRKPSKAKSKIEA